MRKSRKSDILDAIVRIVQRDGVTAVTFDAVAAETGLTRGGLLYHFPSREDLDRATHQHLADQWESAVETTAGKPAAAARDRERHIAYLRACAHAADRAELALMLDSVGNPALDAIWQQALGRWAPPVPDPDDDAALRAFIARLAADGLWSFEALSSQPLPPALKTRIIDALIAMTGDGPTDPA